MALQTRTREEIEKESAEYATTYIDDIGKWHSLLERQSLILEVLLDIRDCFKDFDGVGKWGSKL